MSRDVRRRHGPLAYHRPARGRAFLARPERWNQEIDPSRGSRKGARTSQGTQAERKGPKETVAGSSGQARKIVSATANVVASRFPKSLPRSSCDRPAGPKDDLV